MSPWRTRLYGILIASPCWTILIIGAILTPNPRGHGTHTQLGLSGCRWPVELRWPCPTCGMTTSVSAMMHAAPLAAWRAHPFGVVLTVAAAAFGILAGAQAITGKNLLAATRPRPWWIAIAVAGLFVGWGIKSLTGYLDGTLPLP